MRRNERGNRFLEFGVLLLINELFNIGYDAIPPVTLVTIIGQVLLYVGVINVPWSKWDVCISAKKILSKRDLRSLIFSTFEHADDMHLYYNMISFLMKGRSLEYQYGSANFGLLLGFLCVLTPCIYVGLGKAGAQLLNDYSVMSSCAIGFSGILFALKLITTLENPVGHRNVAGIQIPTRFAAWAELIAIHVLVPNASFMGHLAGIIAGLIYMKTFVGSIIDAIIYCITGRRMVHHRIGWTYGEEEFYHRRQNANYFHRFSNGRTFYRRF